ncbi:DUF1330 domain-containing protein [Trujillonella endophytica]|uniref:Uncharacterized protein n=1 Tax=Trujillonella endophytica TaxID=673521 RepID=A0A1H8QK60_9ACTN|nr:DUF1330 domain-containing protein [Trujillella endophytica]SEO54599.1 protein of unknown function [Trujillella endophytica]
MVYLVTIFPVADYDEYTTQLDGSAEKFGRLGVTRQWLYRATDDGREVMNVFEFPSVEHAKAFLRSPDLDIPRFLDSMTLEIYPTFFLGEQTVAREFPPAPEG